MYIFIEEAKLFRLSNGVFDIITESTREQFISEERGCMSVIYTFFDEQGQDFISLDAADFGCFNLFYRHCESAMKAFPESPRGKIPPSDRIPIILSSWEELLGLMREDPRFDVKLCYPVKSDDQL